MTSPRTVVARDTRSQPQPNRKSSHWEAVARVVQHIRRGDGILLQLPEMAKIALISPFHFDRLFRLITGVPPRLFQCAIRMADAKRLLVESDKTVLDVCLTVGYNSLGTFTRRFSTMVGLSPLKLRHLATEDTSADPAENVGVRPQTANTGSLAGVIKLEENFQGVAVAGLFRTPLPQGPPLACAAMKHGEHTFVLGNLAEGQYYLLCAALATPFDVASLLLAEVSEVGREAVCIEAGKETSAHVVMRSVEPIDPPILTALAPFVLKQYLARSEAAGR